MTPSCFQSSGASNEPRAVQVLDLAAASELGPAGLDDFSVVDLTDKRVELPPGDFDLTRIAAQVSSRFGLRTDVPVIDWCSKPKRSYWAMYYADTEEIMVNPVLRTSAVKEHTIEFLVYHELLHHELPNEKHSPLFREREREFPRWYDANAQLDTLQEKFRF